MSCEEYEQAAVQLPSDEAADAVRATLTQTANAVRDAALEAARRWHDYCKPGLTGRKLDDAERTWYREVGHSSGLLYWITLDDLSGTLSRSTDPVAAAERTFPLATAETSRFAAGFTTIRLAGRRVSWSADGNRVHDSLAEDPVYRALHDQLDAIDWTDGGGGVSWRADEYSLADYGNEGGWTEQAVWGDRDAAHAAA